MAAWTELPGTPGQSNDAGLVEVADRFRLSAPELAVQFALRAIDGATEATRGGAQAILGVSLVHLGRHAEAVEPALAALRAATGSGLVDQAATLRVALAACARVLGEPLAGCELLRPVLQTRGAKPASRALALGQFVACAAHIGGRDDLEDALTEADRLLAADEDLSPDARKLERALLCVRAASYHRRHGDTEAAAESARDGRTLLKRLADPGLEGGRVQTRLTLELVCALLDEGHLDDAVQTAAPALLEPVRATSAPALGRLRLALASRVHLPAGQTEVGRALLIDAVRAAARHQLDSLLADAWTFLAHAEEEASRPSEALHALRSARAAEYRHLRAAAQARAELTADLGATSADRAIALLRSTVHPTAKATRPSPRPIDIDAPAPAPAPAPADRVAETPTPNYLAERPLAGDASAHDEQPSRSARRTRQADVVAGTRSPRADPERVSGSHGRAVAPPPITARHSEAPTSSSDLLSAWGRRGMPSRVPASSRAAAPPRAAAEPEQGAEADRPEQPSTEPQDSFAVTLVRLSPVGVVDAVDPGEPPVPVGDDEVVAAFATHARQLAPPTAELLRSDRGEFAVLLPGATQSDAERLANAIRDTAHTVARRTDDQGREVEIRTGAAAASAEAGLPLGGVDALLQQARESILANRSTSTSSPGPTATPPPTASPAPGVDAAFEHRFAAQPAVDPPTAAGHRFADSPLTSKPFPGGRPSVSTQDSTPTGRRAARRAKPEAAVPSAGRRAKPDVVADPGLSAGQTSAGRLAFSLENAIRENAASGNTASGNATLDNATTSRRSAVDQSTGGGKRVKPETQEQAQATQVSTEASRGKRAKPEPPIQTISPDQAAALLNARRVDLKPPEQAAPPPAGGGRRARPDTGPSDSPVSEQPEPSAGRRAKPDPKSQDAVAPDSLSPGTMRVRADLESLARSTSLSAGRSSPMGKRSKPDPATSLATPSSSDGVAVGRDAQDGKRSKPDSGVSPVLSSFDGVAVGRDVQDGKRSKPEPATSLAPSSSDGVVAAQDGKRSKPDSGVSPVPSSSDGGAVAQDGKRSKSESESAVSRAAGGRRARPIAAEGAGQASSGGRRAQAEPPARVAGSALGGLSSGAGKRAKVDSGPSAQGQVGDSSGVRSAPGGKRAKPDDTSPRAESPLASRPESGGKRAKGDSQRVAEIPVGAAESVLSRFGIGTRAGGRRRAPDGADPDPVRNPNTSAAVSSSSTPNLPQPDEIPELPPAPDVPTPGDPDAVPPLDPAHPGTPEPDTIPPLPPSPDSVPPVGPDSVPGTPSATGSRLDSQAFTAAALDRLGSFDTASPQPVRVAQPASDFGLSAAVTGSVDSVVTTESPAPVSPEPGRSFDKVGVFRFPPEGGLGTIRPDSEKAEPPSERSQPAPPEEPSQPSAAELLSQLVDLATGAQRKLASPGESPSDEAQDISALWKPRAVRNRDTPANSDSVAAPSAPLPAGDRLNPVPVDPPAAEPTSSREQGQRPGPRRLEGEGKPEPSTRRAPGVPADTKPLAEATPSGQAGEQARPSDKKKPGEDTRSARVSTAAAAWQRRSGRSGTDSAETSGRRLAAVTNPDEQAGSGGLRGRRRDRTASSGLADLLAEALVAYQETQPQSQTAELEEEAAASIDQESSFDGDVRTAETWAADARAADGRAAEPEGRRQPGRTLNPGPIEGRHRSSEWAPADVDSG
ncbi:MAG: hypothetical protein M3548_20935 [Actinomycetota bacterium]|nr:hypothetical protein [Actinomycetota bacterium]